MLAVIQTVRDASVTVEGELAGSIEDGMLVYFGVEKDDRMEDLKPFLEKLVKLRIFKDEKGKMNLSLASAGGRILFVSQFTLAGDIYKGNRPGFESAAPAPVAQEFYEEALRMLAQMGYSVSSGRFGEHMLVRYVNDGPETFILDSKRLFAQKC